MFPIWLKTCLTLLTVFKLASCATFNVIVNGTSSHPIPSTLYGLMFEDISSGDGGLYGELLQNRAFQQVTPGTSAALNAWTALGSTSAISVVKSSKPVSTALPNSLSLVVPGGTTGNVGFKNSGYWGINVNSAWTYTASFYYRFPSPPSKQISGSFSISLQSATSGTSFASSSVSFKSSSTWTEVSVQLKPTTSAPDTKNNFVVSVSGATLAGESVEFAMFSLFPPTFKNRPNGMRIDLAETLQAMKPSFFRFPGGNNVEGTTLGTRWQWNNTVGSLLNRPGRLGDWKYINTDGMGLYEYLQWIEDMEMEPIMAVWSGYTLDNSALAESSLQPYIQQAIDQINFVIGDPSKSAAAAMRSSMGHPAPFTLNYVEVGNEEFAGNASVTYNGYRWHDFVTALSAEFPQLTFIATSSKSRNVPTLTPTPKAWDLHVYQSAAWFAENTFYYDAAPRTGPKFFEGEYAAYSSSQGRLPYPTIESAAGEAAFMTGLERNSDIVFAASYAPLLNNVANSQWMPNLISFNANLVVMSTSYYVQKMFSLSKGNQYLPSTLPSTNGTVFWSVTRDSTTNNVFFKVSNTAAASNTVTFTLPYKTISPTGTGTALSGSPTESNTPAAPNSVVPSSFSFSASAKFSYVAPANSVTVLTVNAH